MVLQSAQVDAQQVLLALAALRWTFQNLAAPSLAVLGSPLDVQSLCDPLAVHDPGDHLSVHDLAVHLLAVHLDHDAVRTLDGQPPGALVLCVDSLWMMTLLLVEEL